MSKDTKKSAEPAGSAGSAPTGGVKPKKHRPLTVRDRKVVKGILEGKSMRQAMSDAGFTKNTANAKGSKKLEKLAPTIQALMEKRGLTDDKLLEVLDGGLQANRPLTVSDGKGEGAHIEQFPDHGVRHKYLETGLKLKGHLQSDALANINLGGPSSIVINFNRPQQSDHDDGESGSGDQ